MKDRISNSFDQTIIDNSDSRLDTIITFLRLSTEQRKSYNKLKDIIPIFRSIKFFKTKYELKDHHLEKICLNLNYEFFPANSNVLENEAFGNKFYIIIKGKVSVQIPKFVSDSLNYSPNSFYPNEGHNDLGNYQNDESNFHHFKSKSSYQTIDYKNNNSKTKDQEIRLKGNTKENIDKSNNINIKTIETGGSFGELTIISGLQRCATIKCLEDSHFAVLNRNVYALVLKNIESKSFEKVIQFLSNVPILNSWPQKDLMKLSYYFEKNEFKRNELVYKTKDPTNNIYLISKGEFEISCTVNQNLVKFDYNSTFIDDYCQFKYKPKLLKNVKVGFYFQGQWLGEDEAMMSDFHITTCKCVSDYGELYTISTYDYIFSIYNYEESKDKIHYYSNHKLQNLIQIINYRVLNKFLVNYQSHKKANSNSLSTSDFNNSKDPYSSKSNFHFIKRKNKFHKTKDRNEYNTIDNNKDLELESENKLKFQNQIGSQRKFKLRNSDELLNKIKHKSNYLKDIRNRTPEKDYNICHIKIMSKRKYKIQNNKMFLQIDKFDLINKRYRQNTLSNSAIFKNQNKSLAIRSNTFRNNFKNNFQNNVQNKNKNNNTNSKNIDHISSSSYFQPCNNLVPKRNYFSTNYFNIHLNKKILKI